METTSIGAQGQVICVLGMHRSGTSLISGILNRLGVFLGPEEHLMKADEFNPRGFWEHKLLTDVNEEILGRLGGSWDEPPTFTLGWESSLELADVRQKARAFIEEDFGASGLWGWKDPRTCLTLPLWQCLLPQMKYVICLRNPVDVTRSLGLRNGFSTSKGNSLWLNYIKSALEHTDGRPRLFFFYEDLMADPEPELRRLARFVNKEEMVDKEEVRSLVRILIEEDLQHHKTLPLEVVGEPELDFPTKALFLVLRLSVSLQKAAAAAEYPLDETLQKATDAFGQICTAGAADLADLTAQQLPKEKQGSTRKCPNEIQQAAHSALDFHKSTQAYQRLLSQPGDITRLPEDRQRLLEELAQLRLASEDMQRKLEATELTLGRIYDSQGWKALVFYYRLRNKLLPEGTRRRALIQRLFRKVMDVKKSF